MEQIERPGYAEKLLTPRDVAVWLCVSPKWLYDHISRSEPKVPHLRLGGHIRFRRADVETFLDSQIQGSSRN